MTGTADERAITGAVLSAMRESAVDLAGETTLGVLAALLAHSRLLVSNDTGVSHIAAALRVPSVVVFTGSDPARWAPLDRTRHQVVDGREPAAVGLAVRATAELLEARTVRAA